MQMYKSPVLWAEENQLNGEQIGLWMKNEQADSMAVIGGAYMMSEADTVGFNQLRVLRCRSRLWIMASAYLVNKMQKSLFY